MAQQGSGLGGVLLVVTSVVAALAVVVPEIVGEVTVGVDLGTTFSVAAVCAAGAVEVVPVAGRNTTPSVVLYGSLSSAQPVVVGEPAALQRAARAGDVVFDAKRLIGRAWEDPGVGAEAAHLPFGVEQWDGPGGGVGIRVRSRPDALLRPEDVGAEVVRLLKRAAEAHRSWAQRLGFRFGTVTISVPVAFDDRQRAATARAGELAGFRLVRILEEPVAAALAYGLEHADRERTVMVYDMGGGTLDVALMTLDMRSRKFLVVATAGDPHLGGEDFDRALLARVEQRLGPERAPKAADEREALLRAVEAAKRALSVGDAATVEVPDGGGGVRLTREELEEVCGDLLARAEEPVGRALWEAGMGLDAVDDVVMVGGSSRLVAVQQRVQALFAGRPLHVALDPDTAIAVGAARAFGCSS